MTLNFLRGWIRDEARTRNTSIEGSYVEKITELLNLAHQALCDYGLTSWQEMDEFQKDLVANGLDPSDLDFGLWQYRIVLAVVERITDDEADAVGGASPFRLTNDWLQIKAAIDMVLAIAELHSALPTSQIDVEEEEEDPEDDDTPPPEFGHDDDLGPLTMGEVLSLSGIIGACGEVFRLHAEDALAPMTGEDMEEQFRSWRGQKAGLGRAAQKMAEAERWRMPGLQIALEMRSKDPKASQESIARKIQDDIEDAPAGLRAVTKVISMWEETSQLPKRPRNT